MTHPRSLLLLALVACSTRRTQDVPQPAIAVAPSAMPSASAAARIGPSAPPVPPIEAPLTTMFWSSDALLVTSNRDVWRLDPAKGKGPTAHAEMNTSEIVATDGASVFVVVSENGIERWSASRLEKLGTIDHPLSKERTRGGAIAKNAEKIALGGCVEIAAFPELMTSCGELYDREGKHTASFTTGTQGTGTLRFSSDARFLLALGLSNGLTVIDATTGKSVVTRPGWSAIQEVHGWNRPDVAEVSGSELVVSHGDTVEHVDLATGKTLGKLVVAGRTLATYALRTRRVAVFEGERARLRIWDVEKHAVTRTFELAKYVGKGANCRHCAIDFDEDDENKLWLTSAYTNDRLALDASTGTVEPDRARPNDEHGVWDPSGRYRASIREGVVEIWNRDQKTPIATVGRSPPRPEKKTKR